MQLKSSTWSEPAPSGNKSSWRKPEYPERTHACMERTCKLHTERPPARDYFAWTQDFLLQGNSATNCATLHPFLKDRENIHPYRHKKGHNIGDNFQID
ncbi:hypothetical protein ILYODFUR_028173 [Ilyodon furcidens]|uniref:Uncharacterized protein n=1 Tax=Ilyodon furcidens TaxID=33524 RepID=A0ABV0ULX8_9TELE